MFCQDFPSLQYILYVLCLYFKFVLFLDVIMFCFSFSYKTLVDFTGSVSLNPHNTIMLTVYFSDYKRNPPIVFPSDEKVTLITLLLYWQHFPLHWFEIVFYLEN